MKRTTPPADGAVVHFSTRNMPAALLRRAKGQAQGLRLTIEDAVNLALEVGLATLERQARRASADARFEEGAEQSRQRQAARDMSA